MKINNIGYVIETEVKGSESYLSKFDLINGVLLAQWVTNPKYAKVFKTSSSASKHLKRLGLPFKAWTAGLSETDEKYILTPARH